MSFVLMKEVMLSRLMISCECCLEFAKLSLNLNYSRSAQVELGGKVVTAISHHGRR